MSRQNDILSPADHEVLSKIISLRNAVYSTLESTLELWHTLPDGVLICSDVEKALKKAETNLHNCTKLYEDLTVAVIAGLHESRRQDVIDAVRALGRCNPSRLM